MNECDSAAKSTRRTLLGRVGALAVGTLASAGFATQENETPGNQSGPSEGVRKGRMPTAFIPHGGGPWPVMDLGFGRETTRNLAGYMRSISSIPRTRPKALLVVSAHYEASVPTIMTAPAPPLYYDYSGFPPSAYTLKWPAQGCPETAERVRQVLEHAGIRTAQEPARGFDHGTFIPLMLAYPNAEIPTVQLSLVQGLNPEEHLRIGRALAPLRDEGVFIIGSGNSYHNMRGFMSHDPMHIDASRRFDDWLAESITEREEVRSRRLVQWLRAPAARMSHPRAEHLLPLMVVSGAAEADRGHVGWRGSMMGKMVSAHHFGVEP